jgi:hypothetical protein
MAKRPKRSVEPEFDPDTVKDKANHKVHIVMIPVMDGIPKDGIMTSINISDPFSPDLNALQQKIYTDLILE